MVKFLAPVFFFFFFFFEQEKKRVFTRIFDQRIFYSEKSSALEFFSRVFPVKILFLEFFFKIVGPKFFSRGFSGQFSALKFFLGGILGARIFGTIFGTIFGPRFFFEAEF